MLRKNALNLDKIKISILGNKLNILEDKIELLTNKIYDLENRLNKQESPIKELPIIDSSNEDIKDFHELMIRQNADIEDYDLT